MRHLLPKEEATAQLRYFPVGGLLESPAMTMDVEVASRQNACQWSITGPITVLGLQPSRLCAAFVVAGAQLRKKRRDDQFAPRFNSLTGEFVKNTAKSSIRIVTDQFAVRTNQFATRFVDSTGDFVKRGSSSRFRRGSDQLSSRFANSRRISSTKAAQSSFRPQIRDSSGNHVICSAKTLFPEKCL
jgi:hypothetical protein